MSEGTLVRQPGAPAGLATLLRLTVVPVVGFLCFFVSLAVGIPSDRIALLGLAIATGTLALTVVAVDRIRPRERRSLLFSLFSFSYVVFFVLPVFVFYLGDAGYHPDASPNAIPLTPRVVTMGMFAAFVGYAVLLAGFGLPLGRLAANSVPRMRREWSAGASLGVALVMIPLGWGVTMLGQLGFIPARAGSGVLGTIAWGTTYGIGLIALCYLRYRSKAALLLLSLVIPPTMFFNFFTSSKGLFLRPLVMLAIVHVIATRRLRLWWIVAFIALAAIIYPVSMAYRYYMLDNRLTAVQVIKSPQTALRLMASIASGSKPLEYLQDGIDATSARFDGLGILSVIIRDTGPRVPFQEGWTIGYIALSYVPRLLWPGKPALDPGRWVTANFGYGPHIDSSTGSTWPGELYFNFGWMGLLVGMALLGVWLRFLQDSFLRIDSTIPAMLAGIVVITTVAPNVGGGLLGVTSGVVFNIAPVILVHQLVRYLTPPPSRPPPPL